MRLPLQNQNEYKFEVRFFNDLLKILFADKFVPRFIFVCQRNFWIETSRSNITRRVACLRVFFID